MENVKVWKDDDGTVHVQVDRPGERAVSTEVDPNALIRELAAVAGLDVELRAHEDDADGDA